MELNRIQSLIEENMYKQLKTEFEISDSQSNEITYFRKKWGLPDNYEGSRLAHLLRGHLMSFVSNYFGVKHLGDEKFPSIGTHELMEAMRLIEDIKRISELMNKSYSEYRLIMGRYE